MGIIDELKENYLSRVGHAKIKSAFDTRALIKHPDNINTDYTPVSKDQISEYNKARPRKQKLLCYAPFKNMYFGMDGSATACCYNRTHSFGKFPDRSIHDMWFGDSAKELREYLQCNDLSLGCEGCKYLLDAGNYTGTQAMYFDHYPVNSNKYPTVMQFELSNVCNLECTMCTGEFSSSIRKNQDKLPAIPHAYSDDFIEQLREFIPHLSYAKFYGGEPFLIDQYYKIWDLMAELNPSIKIEIQTNATVLNKRVKDLLDKLNCNINISIDSLDKTTYESIRLNASFEKVQSNISYFEEYTRAKGTKLTISMCPMRMTWQELPNYVKYANGINANLFFHMVWNPERLAIWNLEPEKLAKISNTLLAIKLPRRTAQEKKNAKRYDDYLALIAQWHITAIKRQEEMARIAMEKEQERKKKEQEQLDTKNRLERLKPSITQLGAKKALLTELSSHLEQNSLDNEENRSRIITSFDEQLEYISLNLPKDLMAEEVFEDMLIQRPIKNVEIELRKENMEENLATAITFARKIRDVQ